MSVFKFKQFDVVQNNSAMKIGTDAMVLGALISTRGAKKGLDIGTGTGVLSLMVAQKIPTIRINAIELDSQSAKECEINFKNSPWSKGLTVLHADFLDYSPNETFDLIFSNPPFYQTRLVNDDPRKAAARHEENLPMLAMIEKVAKLIEDTGKFWVIVPHEVEGNWIHTCKLNGLELTLSVKIQGKEDASIKRNVLLFSKTKVGELQQSTLVVRNSDGSYSEEYKALTKEFHYTNL